HRDPPPRGCAGAGLRPGAIEARRLPETERHSTRRMPETRFIDPAVLSRISTMELRARSVVEGFITGLHRSPYKGFSVEFMSYRPYYRGDNLTRFDRKLGARMDCTNVEE